MSLFEELISIKFELVIGWLFYMERGVGAGMKRGLFYGKSLKISYHMVPMQERERVSALLQVSLKLKTSLPIPFTHAFIHAFIHASIPLANQ